MTVRDLLLARAENDRPGLRFEDDAWTWREVVAESTARTSAFGELLDPGQPAHVGVLLDNVPEFAFTLGAAALGGQVVVGLNSTRPGPALARDLERTDCQLVLTDARVPGARLTRVRREGDRWVFDLKGSTVVADDASTDRPTTPRRRRRSAA